MQQIVRNKYFRSLIVCLCLTGISFFNHQNLNPGNIAIWWLAAFFILYTIWFLYDTLTSIFRRKQMNAIAEITSILISIGVGILLFHAIKFLLVSFGWYGVGVSNISLKLTIASLLLVFIQYSLTSIEEVRRIKMENISLEHENLQVKYKLLMEQINPHFLFNSLSTLRSMVRSKDSNTEEFVLKLSDVYREFLKKREATTTSLLEELNFLDTYFFMINTRFEGMIQLNKVVAEQSLNYHLPVFSLNVLLENCIKHNIVSSSSPLIISIYQHTPEDIIIENNLQPKLSTYSMGTGLDNLRDRYLYLGEKSGIEVLRTTTSFLVKLKLLG